MKKFILIGILLVSTAMCAQGTDIYGALTGVLGPGEYNVIGTIAVPAGDSLTIMPATTLIFSGDFDFNIFGYLYAVGTEEDSINFLKNPTSDNWNGLDFLPSASDNSILQYCRIEQSNCIGVNVTGCAPSILNCTFKSCNAGGG